MRRGRMEELHGSDARQITCVRNRLELWLNAYASLTGLFYILNICYSAVFIYTKIDGFPSVHDQRIFVASRIRNSAGQGHDHRSFEVL